MGCGSGVLACPVALCLMMSTIYRFSIRRIPFRVNIWFLFTLLLISIVRLQPLFKDPILALGTFFGIIVAVILTVVVHELGHCWAYRRYGQEPTVLLWGFGGLTFGQARLPPRQHIAVELSGLVLPMVLLWAPTWILWSTVLGQVDTTSSLVIVGLNFVNDLKWVALIWTIVNMLPMIPLDAGHICEAVLELAYGEPRTQTARIVSVVTGVGFGCWSFFTGQPWGLAALFLGGFLALHNWLAYRAEKDPMAPRIALIPESDLESGGYEPNVVSMDSARKKRDRRSPADLLDAGYGALERRDYAAASRTADKLKSKRLNSSQSVDAISLAAWAWLGQRNPIKAEEELAALPKGAAPPLPLAATVALVNKRTDEAIDLMKKTLIAEPDSSPKLIAVDLFAENGMTHRLARDLVDMPNGAGFEAAVALEGLLHRLHRTQDASTVSDVILLG